MARVRDLTEFINNRPSKTYISAALSDGWRWGRLERCEADISSPRSRRLVREARALRHGVRLRYAAD
jgi:hypothetical protein